MPRTAAFTGFTTTGGNADYSSQFNVSGSWNKGYNFFTGINGFTIFFDALGFRNTYNGATGALVCVSVNDYYWSSGASSAFNGRIFYLDIYDVYPQSSCGRSFGGTIRSVAE